MQIKARQNQQLFTQGRYWTEYNETRYSATATHKSAEEFKWYFCRPNDKNQPPLLRLIPCSALVTCVN